MCNLYSITRNQAAIRDLFKVTKDSAGNLPPLPAVFPDNPAPGVRSFEGEREHDALGHARAAAVWRRADHQYP